MGFLEKVLPDLNKREVKKISAIADKVMAHESDMRTKSDAELRELTFVLKERVANGETLDDVLPEAFAVCKEASKRVLDMEHFYVQIIGGIALHQGRIAEMKTGEGKTLVATLPAYLNALAGEGVHVITVNDYLAKRDAEWMGKLYNFLGLEVGVVVHGISDEEKQAAYNADITYGTNNEFGFDYLRDNMVIYKEQLMQRPLNFAIVDEVDSILVDEARTPLIISGQGDKSTDMYKQADVFVKKLRIEEDFEKDEKDNVISLTEEGIAKTEKYFSIDNFSDPDNIEINHHINQALRAINMMQRDVDYVVKDGEILIVDEFTGRLMEGRRYSEGLHQAIEAKEGLIVNRESKTLATITIQNYFRMYKKLAGMTGTAKTEEEEFREIYNMDVVVIPTNVEIQRVDDNDSIYTSEIGKFEALVERVVAIHETGQPILVGTISIEKSEQISDMLKKRGVKHNVLNAKQHEKEARIVAEAGRLNAVTIATNMAGRGTDILLGGNPDFEAKADMIKMTEKDADGKQQRKYSDNLISYASSRIPTEDEEILAAREVYRELYDKYKTERAGEHEKVIELGGLVIFGTERHESRRIDNQLRGRAGRQGDPGYTQFFLSMEDELLRLFGGERMQSIVNALGVPEGEPIEARILSKRIEDAQKRVEGKNFSIRKYVLQYDDVMNKQRETIYSDRRRVIDGEDLKDKIVGMMLGLVEESAENAAMGSKYAEEWDFELLARTLKGYSKNYELHTYPEAELKHLSLEGLQEDLEAQFLGIYEDKETEIGDERMRDLERMILLRVIDSLWMDQIDAMDQLRTGIGLRAIGQQNPIDAYKNEGYDMFNLMLEQIKEDTVKYCLGVSVDTQSVRKQIVEVGKEVKEDVSDGISHAVPGSPVMATASGNGPQAAPKESKEKNHEPVTRDAPKIGRNDPCPCGSGKKYKNCCGKDA
ncbi:MAG: preprotein translocase subunit SecA [Clostridiales Family XIII bacterium]|jgi:preprotein translocase subunit SecA|nr:preprotein translocase subunit SecA [Clostridiales Family XIII bacterium]